MQLGDTPVAQPDAGAFGAAYGCRRGYREYLARAVLVQHIDL